MRFSRNMAKGENRQYPVFILLLQKFPKSSEILFKRYIGSYSNINLQLKFDSQRVTWIDSKKIENSWNEIRFKFTSFLFTFSKLNNLQKQN